jgi:hypothetical protein
VRNSNAFRLKVLALFIVVMGGFFFLTTLLPDCSATSRQAKMARSLSEDRLAELHAVIASLVANVPEGDRFSGRQFSGDSIPSVFMDLDPALVRVGDDSIIRLEGCMDHHLDMRFYGVGESVEHGDHSPRIELVSGEFDLKTEVLWRSKKRSEQGGSSNGG